MGFCITLKKNLKANCSKFMFKLESLKYLGYIILKNKIQTDPIKYYAILEYPAPIYIKNL